MRGILLSICCCIIGSLQGQVLISLQAGYNSAVWNYTEPDNVYNSITTTSSINGFQVGVSTEFAIVKQLGIRAAILFTRKGTKLNHRYRFDTSYREIRMNYIELPVVLTYGFQMNGYKLSLGAGLYGAYGLSGKETGIIHGFITSPVIDNEVSFNGKSEYRFSPLQPDGFAVSRFDFGYTAMVSAQYHRFQLLLGYSGGLQEILTNEYYYTGNFKNKVATISLAYQILKIKR